MREETRKMYHIKDFELPETPEPGTPPLPWDETNVVGKRMPRIDAYERVCGRAIYPSDVVLPNSLYGAILRCPHPHARIRNIDTSKAERMDGVAAVIYRDSPEADLEWPYQNGYKSKLFDDHCRFEGEAVAAVAAEDPYIASDALKSIDVDYEILDFCVDETSALSSDAEIHESGKSVGEPETYERGDVKKGFDKADVILEEIFHAGCKIHTPLERHGCACSWNGKELIVWESTQGVFAVQSRIAEVLKMPLANVRVIGSYMGGGFGSKLQTGKYSIIGAILSKITGRPVKLFLSREETYLCVGNRPPSEVTLKAGVKKDGTLTALDYKCIASGGAYPAGGTSIIDWLIRDLYTCPNVKTESVDVYINGGPARPFRAPGQPQTAWALEQMMDMLAEKIDMDPVEFRLKNIPQKSQARDIPYTSSGLKECIEKGAEEFEWKKALSRSSRKNDKYIKRGVGMASCIWLAGSGNPPSTVILKLYKDGSVNLNMGASDIGTGTKTIMAMVTAEELGVDIDKIQIENADTGTTQFATPSGGSKTVPTEAPAVRNAALEVKRLLLESASDELDEDPQNLVIRKNEVISEVDSSSKLKITEIPVLKTTGEIIGVGFRGPNTEDKAISTFGAAFCEVEVNTYTGEVEILRMLSTQDSGRVMNRLTYDNQVFGGAVMGIGFGMTEERVMDQGNTGKIVNKNWHDYKIPTSLDVPVSMQCVPVEIPDEEANNTGAKGLGEPPIIPPAPAIANAIYNAIGIRVKKTVMNPVMLCTILNETEKES